MSKFFSMLLSFAVFGSCHSALANEPSSIRNEFEEGYDISSYGMWAAMADLKATGFDVGVDPEPFMKPDYAREVVVDEALRGGLREAMSDALRDPFSAKYRRLRMMTNGGEIMVVTCGQVNSKNSFGAFTGYQAFVAMFTNPHANPDVEYIGFVEKPWIEQVCHLMHLD